MALPDIVNHHVRYHLLVACQLRFISSKPPLAHLSSWKSLQLLQSSSVDRDGSSTASTHWPCINRGGNYFNTGDSRLVFAHTDLDLRNCMVSQLTNGLNMFCIAPGVNHAIVEVLVLTMD